MTKEVAVGVDILVALVFLVPVALEVALDMFAERSPGYLAEPA